MRLFVGIALPEDIRFQLSLLCSGLPNVRWVPPANFHITLRFIGEVDGGVMQDHSYAEWTESTQTLESHAAYTEISAVLRTPEWSSKLTGLTTTYRYFSIFGVRPLLGRTYDESETLPGAPQVVVISERRVHNRQHALQAFHHVSPLTNPQHCHPCKTRAAKPPAGTDASSLPPR